MTPSPQHVSLFSTIAVKKALDDVVCDAFTQETGVAVETVYEPTNALLDRIAAGARPDVMIGVTRQLLPLGQSGIVDLSTCTPVARVRVGIAAAGDSEPDITTVDALITTLTAARSVAYSRAGASGLYFAGLLERLGIAEQVNARATVIDSGFAAAAVIDGRADIAVQLMSEHRCVPGANIVGPLPDEVQQITEFSAVLGVAATLRREPQAFIEFLTSKQAREAYSLTGMEAADITPTYHHDRESKVHSK
ncbi:substrate-binding domain-containing protein [Arthrobacter sp. ov118]|uniref:substrate-binding domain-containing protein n=1 Tax=Arthrobacter sp. ov118 TaxID=1761747 RepID=UPI0008E9D89E|nr:substrate-binding domain-containing protein [Arthrobacter sp. ov118]SFU10432.1 molybdate transport system substrate-binding protein [Arthrobacter sp. ov118]